MTKKIVAALIGATLVVAPGAASAGLIWPGDTSTTTASVIGVAVLIYFLVKKDDPKPAPPPPPAAQRPAQPGVQNPGAYPPPGTPPPGAYPQPYAPPPGSAPLPGPQPTYPPPPPPGSTPLPPPAPIPPPPPPPPSGSLDLPQPLSESAPLAAQDAAVIFLKESSLQLAQDLAVGHGQVLDQLAGALELPMEHRAAMSRILRAHRDELVSLSKPEGMTRERAVRFVQRFLQLVQSDATLAADIQRFASSRRLD